MQRQKQNKRNKNRPVHLNMRVGFYLFNFVTFMNTEKAEMPARRGVAGTPTGVYFAYVTKAKRKPDAVLGSGFPVFILEKKPKELPYPQ